MRTSLDRPIGVAKLGEELATALGKPVAMSARMPGQFDEEGKPLPGLLVLLDSETGEALEGVDEKAVKAVLDAHVYVDPDSVPTPVETLVEALEAATTVAGLKAALVDHFTGPAIQAGERRAARIEMKSNGPRIVQGVRPGPFMTGGEG